jgi:tetratricopeptide (TPR) repeat protein
MSIHSMPVLVARKHYRKLLDKAHLASEEGDHGRASKHYEEYLLHIPTDPKVLFNLGALRQQAANKEANPAKMHALYAEAVGYYSRAIESPEPDSVTKADCLNNHGLIMGKLGFPEKAKIAFHFALQLNPAHRAARLNYADILVFDGQYEEADRQFFEIINSDPNSAGAQFSRSMILLMMGEIRRGFREYRSRFAVRSFPSKILQTDKPMWEGESLDSKTLVISCEQGWGDQIQFIRYAELIKQRWPASRVLFSCAESMHALLRGVTGLDGLIVDPPAPPHDFDYHIPLMHLPDVFGTDLGTIPANIPYIKPTDEWVKFEILAPYPPREVRKKIGLVWAGSPTHGKDFVRSMKPAQFQRFIDVAPDCQFYSLQCGPRAHEVQQLTGCMDLAQFITDWTMTANAILQMDLLICVDTAVAHLAGALGKPVWLLLPSSPDFRWMLTREDSPWYPQYRLFRQPVAGDWETVIQQVIAEL